MDNATSWWYEPNGTALAYLADDGKWFYRTSGEKVGYIADAWIYAPDGTPIGQFDSHGEWIHSFTDGQPLGYLSPKLPLKEK